MRPLVLGLAAALAAAAIAHGQPATPEAAAPAAPSPAPCPEAFKAVYKPVGLPFHRSESAAADQVLICRTGYALSFNRDTRNPDWVAEHLTRRELTGAAKRRDNFAADPLLGALGPQLADYSRSGFDRGHQAPAGDAKYDQRVMDETFFLSNMAPQVGVGFNRGQWKNLEETVRAWVLCGGREEIFVFTGPIYSGPERYMRSGPQKTPTNVRIPDAFFKIVYDVGTGRAVGFILPNQKIALGDVAPHARPIREIENETGLDFFRALNRRRQNQLETSTGLVWGHADACAGGPED